jgi:hypothetical protein
MGSIQGSDVKIRARLGVRSNPGIFVGLSARSHRFCRRPPNSGPMSSTSSTISNGSRCRFGRNAAGGHVSIITREPSSTAVESIARIVTPRCALAARHAKRTYEDPARAWRLQENTVSERRNWRIVI